MKKFAAILLLALALPAAALTQTRYSQIKGAPVTVVDKGADPTGVAESTAAFNAAAVTGKPIYVPEGTFSLKKLTLTQDTVIIGAGQDRTVLQMRAGNNDHLLYMQGDHKLTLRDIALDGNAANNTTLTSSGGQTQTGVLVTTGSLDMRNVHLRNFKGFALATGNCEVDFNASTFAHDVFIVDSRFDQTTAAQPGGPSASCPYASSTTYWQAANANCLGDQMRICRTHTATIRGNQGKGGLSGIRSNYYNDHVQFIGNTINATYGDTGITYALSTDGTIVGNTVTDHGGNGIEVDTCWRCSIVSNTATRNGLYGIMMTNYGPPSAASGYQGSMLDYGASIPIAYGAPFGQNYTSKDITISGNTLSQNGRQGATIIGQGGPVFFTGNTVSDNAKTNDGSDFAGLYIDGGSLNLDGVHVCGNVFNNAGYQTASVQQGNVQFQTTSCGNRHIGGTAHFTSATRGTRNLMTDPTLFNAATVATNPGALVADTTSPTLYSRQVTDPGAGGNLTMEMRIPAPAFGKKVVFVRFRTPDTLSKVEVVVNLYTATTFKFTAYDSTRTGIGAGWTELSIPIADTLSSYAYDVIRVSFVTGGADLTQVGSLNVQEVDIFTTGE